MLKLHILYPWSVKLTVKKNKLFQVVEDFTNIAFGCIFDYRLFLPIFVGRCRNNISIPLIFVLV